MSILEDTKEKLHNAGEDIRERWDETSDRASDKMDEMKAAGHLKEAEIEHDAVKQKNDYRESLRT